MGSMATKHTRLMRRGAVYYFRCKIPVDLVDHYGKQEILESLRTRDEREALGLVRTRSEQQEQQFDRIRAGRTVIELSDEQVQGISHEHYVNTLLVDEMSRERGLTEEQYEALEAGIDEGESLLGEALPVGDISQVEHIVDASLKRHGIALPKDSPSYRRLGYAMLQAAMRANDALRERQHSSIVDTPRPHAVHPAAPHANRKDSGESLAGLLARWTAERKPRSKTAQEWAAVVRSFGDTSISGISKQHIIAYKDKLVAAGRASNTIKKHLAALHSLLQCALDNDLIERNPAAAVRVEVKQSKSREHIPLEDLQKLFSSSVFSNGERPRAGCGEAARWLPLLALWTGARLEELGQLRTVDVKRSPDGVDYIEVTDEGEDQKLKTKSSRRAVPLHPTLIQLGFLRYIEEVRKGASGDRVFPTAEAR